MAMGALMVISVLSVRVAEQADPSDALLRGSTTRQMIYVSVGVVGFIIATVIPYQRIGRSAYFFFALNLVLLVLVLFRIKSYESYIESFKTLLIILN